MWMDMDLMEWLKTIGKCLRFQDLIVWVGFSYMLEKDDMSERYLIYKYAVKELALTMTKLHTEVYLNYGPQLMAIQEEWDKWADGFKGMDDLDIIKRLMNSDEACPFQESGFRPYKLICGYIWLRKF